MGIRSVASKPLAKWVVERQQTWMYQPIEAQQQWFQKLIDGGRNTVFGKDHHFQDVHTIEEFSAGCTRPGLRRSETLHRTDSGR